jgi:hypothetical protein
MPGEQHAVPDRKRALSRDRCSLRLDRAKGLPLIIIVITSTAEKGDQHHYWCLHNGWVSTSPSTNASWMLLASGHLRGAHEGDRHDRNLDCACGHTVTQQMGPFMVTISGNLGNNTGCLSKSVNFLSSRSVDSASIWATNGRRQSHLWVASHRVLEGRTNMLAWKLPVDAGRPHIKLCRPVNYRTTCLLHSWHCSPRAE